MWWWGVSGSGGDECGFGRRVGAGVGMMCRTCWKCSWKIGCGGVGWGG